ncbi:MAG: preprotein translocase subunit SecE [Planctomycetia bacterium]|nr:preprotein translocase subunit SecE [Planctomycetia bacterium]
MSGFWSNFVSVAQYKRNQGRVTRQATFWALAFASVISGYGIGQVDWASSVGGLLTYGLPALVIAVFCWISWRVVQLPAFADFLISVEAEMMKVSWPSWSEVFRSSLVVIFVMFAISATLFFYDTVFVTILMHTVY